MFARLSSRNIHRNLHSLRNIGFPIDHAPGNNRPNVIYCHGLGGAWFLPLAMKMQQYVAQAKGCGFTRFQYRHVQDLSRVWHVDRWLEDIISILDAMWDQVGPQILMASSAAAQPVLRATLERPEKVHSLLLLAPGVGLDLNYMERIMPGSRQLLKQGKKIVHRAQKGGYDAVVDLKCLNDYVNSCPSNRLESIPIKCPVRILHGLDDFVVLPENSKRFVEKLESEDVKLTLLENQSHTIQMIPEVVEMMDELIAMNENLPLPKTLNLKPLPDFVQLQHHFV